MGKINKRRNRATAQPILPLGDGDLSKLCARCKDLAVTVVDRDLIGMVRRPGPRRKALLEKKFTRPGEGMLVYPSQCEAVCSKLGPNRGLGRAATLLYVQPKEMPLSARDVDYFVDFARKIHEVDAELAAKLSARYLNATQTLEATLPLSVMKKWRSMVHYLLNPAASHQIYNYGPAGVCVTEATAEQLYLQGDEYFDDWYNEGPAQPYCDCKHRPGEYMCWFIQEVEDYLTKGLKNRAIAKLMLHHKDITHRFMTLSKDKKLTIDHVAMVKGSPCVDLAKMFINYYYADELDIMKIDSVCLDNKYYGVKARDNDLYIHHYEGRVSVYITLNGKITMDELADIKDMFIDFKFF